MPRTRVEKATEVGIAAALVLTLCFSALAFTYLRNPASGDPWTYRENADRTPAEALDDIAHVLAGSRGRFIRIEAPATGRESHRIHFEWRGQPLVVRVMPDPAVPHRERLVWDTPGGPRTICDGVRPGGFRALDLEESWTLRLEVVRMDKSGRPADLAATKVVKKPPGMKKS